MMMMILMMMMMMTLMMTMIGSMRKDRIGGSDKSSLEGKRRQNTSFPVRPNGIAKSNGDGPDGDDCNHGDEEI